MIFYRKGVRGQTKKGDDILYDLDSKINFAVFPGLQVTDDYIFSAQARAYCGCVTSCLNAAKAADNVAATVHRFPSHSVLVSSCAGTNRQCFTGVHAVLQGGPHNHTISGLACALKQATTSEFKEYQEQVWMHIRIRIQIYIKL